MVVRNHIKLDTCIHIAIEPAKPAFKDLFNVSLNEGLVLVEFLLLVQQDQANQHSLIYY